MPIMTSELTSKPKFTERERRAVADRWTGKPCYLNDKPASIRGRILEFGLVCTDDGAQSVNFCWEAINRIMYGKMEFRS